MKSRAPRNLTAEQWSCKPRGCSKGPQLASPSCCSFLQPDYSVLCKETPHAASRIVNGEANYEAGRGAAVSHGFIKA